MWQNMDADEAHESLFEGNQQGDIGAMRILVQNQQIDTLSSPIPILAAMEVLCFWMSSETRIELHHPIWSISQLAGQQDLAHSLPPRPRR
jgi:hypothetical protein